MLKRMWFVLAIISAFLLTSAPAASSMTWRPKLIPLTTNTRLIASSHYAFLCNGGWRPETREEHVWQSSFCGHSKTNTAASRLGWCHRWAIQKPNKISVTCDRDIHRLFI